MYINVLPRYLRKINSMESKQQIDNEIKLGWSKPTKFKNKKLNILISKLIKIQEDGPFKNRDRNLQDKKKNIFVEKQT